MAERYEYRVRYRTPDWCIPTSFPAHSEAAARKQADDFRSLLVGDVWIEVRVISDWERLVDESAAHPASVGPEDR